VPSRWGLTGKKKKGGYVLSGWLEAWKGLGVWRLTALVGWACYLGRLNGDGCAGDEGGGMRGKGCKEAGTLTLEKRRGGEVGGGQNASF